MFGEIKMFKSYTGTHLGLFESHCKLIILGLFTLPNCILCI